MIDFDKYAKEIHEQNKSAGWWDDPNRNVLETLQLVSTEIAEATEGERKDLMDDHLPHRKMGEVELADALIRMLDIVGRCGWVFGSDAIEKIYGYTNDKMDHCKEEPIGALHSFLGVLLFDGVGEIDFDWSFEDVAESDDVKASCASFLCAVIFVGKTQGYDIESAMIEKLEYNRHRADHKRENRAKENGKKF